MQATLWPRRQGVVSHDSALDLWDLCDVNPAKIHVTLPKATRVRRTAPPVYEVHVRDLDPADITRFEGIPVVTPARAILDGIERHLDQRLIDQAIETAGRQGLVTRDELAVLEGSADGRVPSEEQGAAQRERARTLAHGSVEADRRHGRPTTSLVGVHGRGGHAR
jgi:hypothetical protein